MLRRPSARCQGRTRVCRSGAVYTGIARNAEVRYAQHVAGTGARYTHANPPRRLLVKFACVNQSEAGRMEAAIKKLTALNKRKLVVQWSFVLPTGSTETIVVKPVLCGDSLVVRQRTLRGEGVAYKADVDVAADLRAGRLVRLLAEYEGEAVPISALMPSGRFVPARVRAMVDYLA